jgi:sulfur transfer complex TusBCD TusB component (DsrH family)
MNFVKSENPKAKVRSPFKENEMINFFPTKHFSLPIDSAMMIQKGIVAKKDANKIVDEIEWSTGKSYALKADLMVLDLIASFNWDRPI